MSGEGGDSGWQKAKGKKRRYKKSKKPKHSLKGNKSTVGKDIYNKQIQEKPEQDEFAKFIVAKHKYTLDDTDRETFNKQLESKPSFSIEVKNFSEVNLAEAANKACAYIDNEPIFQKAYSLSVTFSGRNAKLQMNVDPEAWIRDFVNLYDNDTLKLATNYTNELKRIDAKLSDERKVDVIEGERNVKTLCTDWAHYSAAKSNGNFCSKCEKEIFAYYCLEKVKNLNYEGTTYCKFRVAEDNVLEDNKKGFFVASRNTAMREVLVAPNPEHHCSNRIIAIYPLFWSYVLEWLKGQDISGPVFNGIDDFPRIVLNFGEWELAQAGSFISECHAHAHIYFSKSEYRKLCSNYKGKLPLKTNMPSLYVVENLKNIMVWVIGPSFYNKFDDFERRLNDFDGRLNDIDGRLENVDGRLENVEKKVDKIDKKFDEVNEKVDIMSILLTRFLEASNKSVEIDEVVSQENGTTE